MILQDALHVEHPDLLGSPLATHVVLRVVHLIGLWVGNFAFQQSPLTTGFAPESSFEVLPIVRGRGIPVFILFIAHQDIFPEVVAVNVEVGNPPIEKSGERLGGPRDGPPLLADWLLLSNSGLAFAVELVRPIDFVIDLLLGRSTGGGIAGRFAEERGGVGGGGGFTDGRRRWRELVNGAYKKGVTITYIECW